MVSVLYYASAREATKKDQDDIDIEETFSSKTVSLEELLTYVDALYSESTILKGALVAVNNEYCNREDDIQLTDKDSGYFQFQAQWILESV
ncbi:hypothetical protein LPJ79_001358 [Coemansia sp. RSA 1821]|nr:hypothetical protein LPJ79_001358 [Coemansia sp. RSA 1821]